MKTTVRNLFWICMLLMLFAALTVKTGSLVRIGWQNGGTAEVPLLYLHVLPTSDNSDKKKNSLFTNTKVHGLRMSNWNKIGSFETYSSHQQRFAWVIEDNQKHSFDVIQYENLLVQGPLKLCYSDKDPLYALTDNWLPIFIRFGSFDL